MAVQLWYLGVTFLVYLQYTDAGGSCQENIYLEVGKQGVVPCHFQNFEIIGWINGSGDVRKIPPFIYMEGSQIYGRGYRSGDYDMHPNGTLIINEVKLTNEYNYTVLFDPQLAGENEYFKVPVKVYVLPNLGYPVVNGRTNQVVVHGNTRGFINCSMTGIRPSVHLEWVFSQDEISLNNSHRVTDNSDGTYSTFINSSYKVINSPTGRVSFECRVAGQMADLFSSVTTVYLLLEQRFPAVNGLANQEHVQVVLHVNREGELTCSMDKVSQDVSLELVTIFPDSSDEIVLDNKNHITANEDGTVNITLTSRFRVLSALIQHFILQCRVSGQEANKYPETTTVELLVTETTSMLPVPVIDGCYSQPEACTLLMTTEETITCSVKGVPHYYDLNLDLYTLPDLRCLSLITNKIDTHRSGYYDIITSCHYNVDETFIDTIVHCFLSGFDRNIQPVNSTVKAKVMWQDQDSEGCRKCEETVTDQDKEGKISRLLTLITVLLVFLTIEINLFLLTPSKLFKDYVRKFYRNCANSRQQDLAEAEHSIRQEEGVPLQPVNNKDNIEARCCQCIPLRETHAKICHLLKKCETFADSGVSSSPSSSTASRDPRDLEVRNAQGNEC